MLQREVYFPWSRRNRYGPAQTPHGPLISLIVAGPNVLNFSNILSGFWHSGSQGTMLDIHPLYPPWFFDSSQAPYQGRFLNATKRHLFMRHSPSSTSSTFSSLIFPHCSGNLIFCQISSTQVRKNGLKTSWSTLGILTTTRHPIFLYTLLVLNIIPIEKRIR